MAKYKKKSSYLVILAVVLLCPFVLAQSSLEQGLVSNQQELKKALENPWQLFQSLLLAGVVLFVSYQILRFLLGKIKGLRFRQGNWDIIDILFCFSIYFFLILMSSAFLQMIGYTDVDKHYFVFVFAHVLTQVASCGVIYFFLTQKLNNPPRKLGFRKINFIQEKIFLVLPSYLFFLPFYFFCFWVSLIALTFLEISPQAQQVAQKIMEAQGPAFALGVFSAVVAAPLTEEFIFRVFLYTGLRDRLGVVGANLASSFIFALVHQNALAFLPIFALGVFFAYLYEKSQTMVLPVLAHACHNALTLGYLLYQNSA